MQYKRLLIMDPHFCGSFLHANHNIAWLNHFFEQIFQELLSKNIVKYCEFMFLK